MGWDHSHCAGCQMCFAVVDESEVIGVCVGCLANAGGVEGLKICHKCRKPFADYRCRCKTRYCRDCFLDCDCWVAPTPDVDAHFDRTVVYLGVGSFLERVT